MIRRLAKDTEAPKTKEQLKEAQEIALAFHDRTLSEELIKILKLKAGKDFEAEGIKVMGEEIYDRLYTDRKIPNLRTLVELGNKLGYQVHIVNYPMKNSGAVPFRDLVFIGKLHDSQLVRSLERLALDRKEQCDSDFLKNERANLLARYIKARPRFDWAGIHRYAAACGYQTRCFLMPIGPNSFLSKVS